MARNRNWRHVTSSKEVSYLGLAEWLEISAKYNSAGSSLVLLFLRLALPFYKNYAHSNIL